LFTGLVQALGRIARTDDVPRGARLEIETPLAAQLHEGDSVAVNGVCLTAIDVRERAFAAEVMSETLARSSLSGARAGRQVNLELPLRAADRLGGHIVQGHVDGIGTVAEVADDGIARRVRIEAAPDVLRYVVEKGSIAVDGISLTVTGVESESFTVSLIPETLRRTNLGQVEAGTTVNLEVDVLAKYVEKLVGSLA
jgi:riboflavin synthase